MIGISRRLPGRDSGLEDLVAFVGSIEDLLHFSKALADVELRLLGLPHLRLGLLRALLKLAHPLETRALPVVDEVLPVREVAHHGPLERMEGVVHLPFVVRADQALGEAGLQLLDAPHGLGHHPLVAPRLQDEQELPLQLQRRDLEVDKERHHLAHLLLSHRVELVECLRLRGAEAVRRGGHFRPIKDGVYWGDHGESTADNIAA
mmetsp:Transcript_69291/g.181569  ORF Transcript_69291/g.181569 Transcript_69291/m.181569 type:complete len:205 (+) Transcript_69291:547-1161(+)